MRPAGVRGHAAAQRCRTNGEKQILNIHMSDFLEMKTIERASRTYRSSRFPSRVNYTDVADYGWSHKYYQGWLEEIIMIWTMRNNQKNKLKKQIYRLIWRCKTKWKRTKLNQNKTTETSNVWLKIGNIKAKKRLVFLFIRSHQSVWSYITRVRDVCIEFISQLQFLNLYWSKYLPESKKKQKRDNKNLTQT